MVEQVVAPQSSEPIENDPGRRRVAEDTSLEQGVRKRTSSANHTERPGVGLNGFWELSKALVVHFARQPFFPSRERGCAEVREKVRLDHAADVIPGPVRFRHLDELARE